MCLCVCACGDKNTLNSVYDACKYNTRTNVAATDISKSEREGESEREGDAWCYSETSGLIHSTGE